MMGGIGFAMDVGEAANGKRGIMVWLHLCGSVRGNEGSMGHRVLTGRGVVMVDIGM